MSSTSKSLNLAFCLFKFYPFGGLEQSFLNIAKESLKRGHQVTVYCYRWEGDIPDGLNVVVLHAAGLSNHGKAKAFVKKVQKAIAGIQYDLVVGFKRMPGLDLYYNGDVCFVREYEQKHSALAKLLPRYRVFSAFERAVFSKNSSTSIMYIAPQEKQVYQEVYRTPDARFHLLPPGIRKQRIREACTDENRAKVRNALAIPTDHVVFLMVGSDFVRKGVDRSLKAFANLTEDGRHNWMLLIAGKGDASAFQNLLEANNIKTKVKFLGARSDIPDLLAASDVLLHPAIFEVAGNAILEGLVAGKPVLVSAAAGFSSHVAASGGGKVISASPFDVDGYTRAIRELIVEPAIRARLGSAAWDYADKEDLYSRPETGNDIIESLAEKKRS